MLVPIVVNRPVVVNGPMTFIPDFSRSESYSWEPRVDDVVANLIIAQLLFLESEEPDKDINFYINSPAVR